MRARGPHKALGLYAHLTWHTWRRELSIRNVDVAVITGVALEAAVRCRVRVHAQAVLADHVHVLVSYPPDTSLWARGFCAGSLSRSHVRPARLYIANQHSRHPDRIPI